MIDTELQERLKKFLSAQRISNSEFGRLTGTSASYVNSVKSSISFPMLRKIAEVRDQARHHNISITDVYTDRAKTDGNGNIKRLDFEPGTSAPRV